MGSDGNIIFPGYEWAVLKLGATGIIQSIEVDTCHFKGNFPESILIEGIYISPESHTHIEKNIVDFFKNCEEWVPILSRTKLSAHLQHYFDCKVESKVNYVRVSIFPDGGVSRIRLNGRLSK
jgi:allantoicase